MKRWINLILGMLLTISLLTGCAGDKVETPQIETSSSTTEASMPQESAVSTSEGDAVTEDNTEISPVYMTTDMTPEALIRLYDALEITLPENITVRTAMDDYHLSSELVGGLAQHLNATISECTSVAGGSASAPVHYQMAEDIGFADYAPIDIMDENGSLSLPVANGIHLSENLVGNNMENYESMVLMTRFRSHYYAGYGGMLKSLSIGLASGEGKAWIHSAGTSITDISGDLTEFKEGVVDAASSVMDYFDGNIVYINVIDGYSVECDCPNHESQSEDIHSIGILASTDPVALDKACLDLMENSELGLVVFEKIESQNGLYLINHAYERGLGNIEYEIINID